MTEISSPVTQDQEMLEYLIDNYQGAHEFNIKFIMT